MKVARDRVRADETVDPDSNTAPETKSEELDDAVNELFGADVGDEIVLAATTTVALLNGDRSSLIVGVEGDQVRAYIDLLGDVERAAAKNDAGTSREDTNDDLPLAIVGPLHSGKDSFGFGPTPSLVVGAGRTRGAAGHWTTYGLDGPVLVDGQAMNHLSKMFNYSRRLNLIGAALGALDGLIALGEDGEQLQEQ